MASGARDRDATTLTLRDAALTELLEQGQAAFTMDGVARRAFYSIGTVYGRWPDRESLLADLGGDVIAPGIAEAVDAAGTAAEAIAWALGEGQEQVLLAGEIMLAGQTMPTVRPAALDAWASLRGSLSRRLPDSMGWYVATYAIGNALLGAIGVRGPEPSTGRVPWLAEACATVPYPAASEIARAAPDDVEIPIVPSPTRADDVTLALIGAAQLLLQEQGVAGTTTRDIAASAGVTTGALYRRYEGKAQLLADVLLTQLQPDRYTWTWSLVRALASGDPYSDAAAVVAQRMIEVAQDEASQRVLLQVGIAARSDPGLQSQIAERVRIAHEARVEMVRHFADAGLLRGDVTPEVFAWGLQAVPVGVRAVLPLGVGLDAGEVSESMEALLRAAAVR